MTEEQVPFGGNMKVPSDDCEQAFKCPNCGQGGSMKKLQDTST